MPSVPDIQESLVVAPPPLPGEAGPSEPADSGDNEEHIPPLLLQATGTMAVGYYLSTLLHILAYALAAVFFAYFGRIIQEDEIIPPIRASLDDIDRDAEQPKLEIAPLISAGSVDGDSSIQRMSNNLQMVENGLKQTLDNSLLPSAQKKQDDPDDDAGEGDFLFKLPESGLAVTRGSFTVWTEPESPNVQEPYFIIIEVMLPAETRAYRINDLSGYVVGSDKYRQKIPYDPGVPNAAFYTDENKQLKKISGSEQIKVRRQKVQLAIKVPGAVRLVRDTIQIRSRRLRETQELELVFGGDE